MPDGAHVQYNFGDLAELSGAIHNAHGAVDSLKADINASANQLQADWSGQATESWSTVQQKWLGACDQLLQALHQLALTVQQNSEHMALTEARNAHLFQDL
jgi:WXG100 family type VII secretion target